VLLPPVSRSLIHGYEEPLASDMMTYCLDEIVAEKCRALLQTHAKLQARGWNRPRARDYYDLWRILGTFRADLDLPRIRQCLDAKCVVRGVAYAGLDDFFTPLLVGEAQRAWASNLGAFVRNLPSCEQVLDELRLLMVEVIPEVAADVAP
jgi:hypothetical protein